MLLGFPRIIWLLWFQGWQCAPPIVQACAYSWRKYHPGWKIVLLDGASYSRYISIPKKIWFDASFPLAALSDVVRVHLLARYGGVWADATVFCCQSLDSWLDRYFVEDLFAFKSPPPYQGRERLLSSWFLASARGGDFASGWKAATADYWRRSPYMQNCLSWCDNQIMDQDYFWFHALFPSVLGRADLKARWDLIPEFPAAVPQRFAQFRFLEQVDEDAREHIDNVRAPMYKLNHRRELPADYEARAIGRLFARHIPEWSPGPSGRRAAPERAMGSRQFGGQTSQYSGPPAPGPLDGWCRDAVAKRPELP